MKRTKICLQIDGRKAEYYISLTYSIGRGIKNIKVVFENFHSCIYFCMEFVEALGMNSNCDLAGICHSW